MLPLAALHLHGCRVRVTFPLAVRAGHAPCTSLGCASRAQRTEHGERMDTMTKLYAAALSSVIFALPACERKETPGMEELKEGFRGAGQEADEARKETEEKTERARQEADEESEKAKEEARQQRKKAEEELDRETDEAERRGKEQERENVSGGE
jgi:hypothetical protein